MTALSEHGLVIGKFYPPHLGHHLLIRTAAAVCRRVSVIVMASQVETIPLSNRVAWLAAAHRNELNVEVTGVMDEHRVDFESEAVWAAHVALMRDGLAALAAPRVTAVFTSEPYGAELARRFHAAHVAVDPDRRLVPISARAIRRDVAANWEYLAEPTRAGLAFRVVVLGAESTGTTTLAADLADHWRARGGVHRLTRWVPEFGRAYSIEKYAQARAAAQLAGKRPPTLEELVWESPEFEAIARTQLAQEDSAAAQGGPILICDTDAFATTIWHERYVGGVNPAVQAIAEQRSHPLYLLTHHDGVPYEQDGLRDGAHIRSWMTQRFIARLSETGRNSVVLRGDRGQRLRTAIEAIEAELPKAFTFAPPLSPEA
jgi:NadR type nicotinamide-nucleotide adenylyltransferase